MKFENQKRAQHADKLNALARQFSTAALLVTALLSAARSRGTTTYSADPQPESTSSTVTIIDGSNTLPKGFYDQSANAGHAELALDGTTSTSLAIRLWTQPVTNAAGGFNGTGTGNRAILGNDNYDTVALTKIQPITFDGQYYGSGTATMSVSVIVDFNCDQTTIRVFSANSTALQSGVTAIASSTYDHFDAGFDQNIWQVSGSSLLDSSSNVVVPSISSGKTSTLTAFMTANPKACLTNIASGDTNLPNGLPTAGLLFTLGTPSTTDANGAFISKITVGSDSFESSDWGNQ